MVGGWLFSSSMGYDVWAPVCMWVHEREKEKKGRASYCCTPTWMMCELESLSSVPTKKLTKSWVPYFSFSLATTSSNLHVSPGKKEEGEESEERNNRKEMPVGNICCMQAYHKEWYHRWSPSCPELWASQTHQAACQAKETLLFAQLNLTDKQKSYR